MLRCVLFLRRRAQGRRGDARSAAVDVRPRPLRGALERRARSGDRGAAVSIYPSMNECVECGAENLGAAAWVGVMRHALDWVLVLVAHPQPS